jgi:hypothetical protein
MAKVGAGVGNCACGGRGEHGITGLGSSIGDDVGDKDSRGDGKEYIELASDCRCPRTGDSLRCAGMRSKGKAASSSGSNIFCAKSPVFGMIRARSGGLQ